MAIDNCPKVLKLLFDATMLDTTLQLCTGRKDDDPQSPSYLPTIFDFESDDKQQQKLRRYQSLVQRNQKKSELEEATAAVPSCEVEENKENEPSLPPTEHSIQKDYKALEEEYRSRLLEIKSLKQIIASSPGRGFPSEDMLKKDDKLVSFYTGLPNYGTLMAIFQLVSSHVTYDTSLKLSNFQCVLLCLMKLRLGLTNYDLGFRFCLDGSNISRILIKWLQIMDIRLTPLIKWPNREQLKKTMPWCFRLQYGLKVTSIIDCFEIFIEKPGDLMSKAATWSTYKHHNTAKYLISITPQGTISFISKGYGGRVSDKFITENSGFLGKLLPGDIVLADRGFNVEEAIGYMGATLNIPSFTKGKSQLTPKEIESTRRLANVRIHVERIIGAVRQRFQILSATVPIPTEYTRSKRGGPVLLDTIVRVCCALENVCDSVISAN